MISIPYAILAMIVTALSGVFAAWKARGEKEATLDGKIAALENAFEEERNRLREELGAIKRDLTTAFSKVDTERDARNLMAREITALVERVKELRAWKRSQEDISRPVVIEPSARHPNAPRRRDDDDDSR